MKMKDLSLHSFPQRVKKGLGSFWSHRESSETGASDQLVGRPERFGRRTSNDMAAVYLPDVAVFLPVIRARAEIGRAGVEVEAIDRAIAGAA
jgi:hypothetical protein